MGSAINPKVRAEQLLKRLGILTNDVHDILIPLGDCYYDHRLRVPLDFQRKLGRVLHLLRSEAIEAAELSYLIQFLAKSFDAQVINEFVEAVGSRDFERMKMASLRLDTAIAGFHGALNDAAVGCTDPWSTGRSKRDWLALKAMTKDQWDAMREANTTRIQNTPDNRRLWQFKKSLCDERGFCCPEFAEKQA